MGRLNVLYSLGYCFFYSIATVLISALPGVPISTSLVITAAIAVLYFNLIAFNTLRGVYYRSIQNWHLVLAVNLIGMTTWYFTYKAIDLSTPNLVNFSVFLTIGFCGALRSKQFLKIAVTALALSTPLAFNWHQYLAVICAMTAGVSAYLYNVVSHRLAEAAQLSSVQILAVRFYLMVLLLFPYTEIQQFYIVITHPYAMLMLTTIAFSSFIIPLYLAQQGIMKLGVQEHSFLMTFVPIMTYLLEGIFLHQWSWPMLILSTIAPVILNDTLYRKLNRTNALP